jgi:hypothetical protein
MGYLVGVAIVLGVVLLGLVIAFSRAGARRTETEPERPEDHGTSYEEPQDEGP